MAKVEIFQGDKIPVGISSCLLGEKVRFDGQQQLDSCIEKTLGEHFAFRSFCPEVPIGLGIPHRSSRLIAVRDSAGIYAAPLMKNFPDLPVEEEGRLGIRCCGRTSFSACP